MDKYEQLAIIGEGSYGVVMKCRHRGTGQIVAIKKFLETEEDASVRKIALREVRTLRRLRHENLIAMIEVFRHRKRFYLVFEHVEGTLLDELERTRPGGIGEGPSRERIFQVTRALGYCHSNSIIHRDVKPENVLVSTSGVVKLCDFGFARFSRDPGDVCTEYVATRWYRAPELLVGEPSYGTGVDVWALGCLLAEMMTGEPLFPGESDIDQLHRIVRTLGTPCARHLRLIAGHPRLRGVAVPEGRRAADLRRVFPLWQPQATRFLASCLEMEPAMRPAADELLDHPYFTHDGFSEKFLSVVREKVSLELDAPLLRKLKSEILTSTDKEEQARPHRTTLKPYADSWRFTLTVGTSPLQNSSSTFQNSAVSQSLSTSLNNENPFTPNNNSTSTVDQIPWKLPLLNPIHFNFDCLPTANKKQCVGPTSPAWWLARNKKKSEEVFLPDVPSKMRYGKRNLGELDRQEVTPEYRYMKGKRKRNTLDICLPIPVKQR